METWLKDVEGIKTVMKFKNNIYMMTTYKTLHTKYKIILVLCTLYRIDMMCIMICTRVTRVWYKCPVSCAVVHCEGGTKKGAFSSGEGLVCVEMMMPHNSVFFSNAFLCYIYTLFYMFFFTCFFVLKLGET